MILIAFLAILGTVDAFGQHRVSGTVIDASTSDPLPGVNILVKGTAQGATTNTDGVYELSAPSSSDTLVFSFIGFQSQEVAINERSQINVSLEPQTYSGEDIVVVGYGVQRKVDVTGSVSIVNSEELKKSSSPTLAGALQGQVSGVQVTSSGAPGESPEMNIRGIGTFGSNNPLYIVDGVPVDNIIDFNTDNIESVQVLKDAAAAAIYGARAANGVVIITTNKGQSGLRVDYNGSVGAANIHQRIDVMGREGYQQLNNEAITNAGPGGPGLAPANNPSSEFYINDIDTDWQDVALEPGYMTEHNLTVSGGNENSIYSISAGYLSQEGHMRGNAPYYDRYSGRINSEHDFGNLTVGQSLYYSTSHRDNQQSRHEISLINNMIKAIPTMPIYDDSRLGGYGGADANIERAITLNPVGVNNLLESYDDVNRFLGNLWAEYDILDNLAFKVNFSYDNRETRNFFFIPTYDMGFFFTNDPATLDETRGELTNTLIESTLNYDRTTGKHNINLLAGYTEERGNYEEVHGHAEGYTRPFFKVIDAGTSGKTVTGFRTKNTLRSFIGRVQYDYDERYLLTASVRRDGSSRFGEDNRYGVFPSVSVGWRISNESFFNLDWVNELKLRGSYGELGRQDIDNFATTAFINTYAGYNFADQPAPGAIQVSIANSDIKWETSISRDIGLDLSMLENKIEFSADYYNNKSKDILLAKPIPLSVGASGNPIINAATIQNTGLEFSLTYRNSAGEVDYSLGGNITNKINNEVLSLGGDAEPIFGAASKTAVGGEVGQLFGYVTEGLVQSQDEINLVPPTDPNFDESKHAFQTVSTAPGDIKFRDLDGNGTINDEDRAYLGSAIPNFFYGINASVNYKNFDLSTFIQGTYGNKIYNQQRLQVEHMSGYDNYSARMVNRWTPDNSHNNVEFPRAVFGDPNDNNRASDRYVEDGSYLRVKNLTIGYSLPADVLNRVGVGSLRVYISGQNLFTITGYSGLDPDLGDDGDEVDNDALFSRGFDAGAWPNPRILKAGIQLSL